VRFVTARDPWESARIAAAWVASQPKDTLPNLVVICPPRNRGILKTAFEARGIPFGGDHSEVSYARPSLQVLILALNLAWAPKDPALALALITSERSPVPGKLRRKLIESLNSSKAIGGTKWNQALEAALEERLKEITEVEEQEKLKRGAERVREWFSAPAFALQDGIPQKEVQAILTRVRNWLLPQERETKNIVDLLSALVSNLGEEKVTQERLFQHLMEAVGDGVASLLDPARAQGPRVVDSPAAISAPADTILWWDFVEAAAGIERDPFFAKSEIERLKAQGIEWPDFGARLIEQGASFHRGVRMASSRVLFFHALMDQTGNPESQHPLHSELIPEKLQSEWAAKTGIRLTEANDPAVVDFLKGAGAKPETPKKELLNAFRVEWKIPAPGPGLRATESASSLEQLLGCELAYLLKYPAKLKGEDRDSIQYDESTKGIIAHAVLAGVFEKGAKLSPKDARKKAEGLFDGIAMDQAPLLFQKAQSGELYALKERIFRAVETYGAFLQENQLEIEAAEMDVSSSQLQIAGVALTGSIDHVLVDSKKRSVIVDHKWGKKGYKQKALEEGTSLQLALYSLLISGNVDPVLAYHMILARDVLVLNEPYRLARHVKGPKGSEVLQIAEKEVEKAKAILAHGAIWARGLTEEPEGAEARPFEAPCRFCDYQKICGKFFEVSEK
jgi:RecB family exonuclease